MPADASMFPCRKFAAPLMFGPNMHGTLDGGTDPSAQFIGDAFSASGVFSIRESNVKYGIGPEASAVFGCRYLDFNASDGNSTFSGNKLQPSALQTLPCIRT